MTDLTSIPKRRPFDEAQHDPVSDPPPVEGLSQEDAVEAIKDWFLQNFEDPVHGTPHDSSEGGYLYIWGGPYEARDILESFYADTASEELIDAALDELESESLEWVPSAGRRQPPEDWIDQDIAANPCTIFMDSYHHTGDLLAEHGSDDGSHLVFAAIDGQRAARRLTWRRVAEEANVAASTLTRLSQGRHPDVDSLAALCT